MCPERPPIDPGFAGSVLEHSLNPIIVINPDASIKYVNPAFEELTGFSSDEIVGSQPPFPYWHPDHWSQYSQENLPEKPYRGQRLFRKKNGEEFWIEVSATPVKDQDEVRFIVVNWVDITSSKRASEALRASEAFNTSLMENAPNPMLVGTVDSEITYVNPAFERLTGYSSAEVISKKPPFPWSLKKELLFTRDGNSGEEICNLELCHRKKNGELFWVEANIKRVSEKGLPGYVLASWVDISERKKAEQRLQEASSFNLSILENAPIPMLIQNPDSSIRYVNPALVKLTGFAPDELLNKKPPYPYWQSDRSGVYLPRIQEAFQRAEGEDRVERTFRKKSGETFFVELTNTPVKDNSGNLHHFVTCWVDLTERKKMEAERAEMEHKAQIANRLASIGEMAAGIAHEINNPLTSVIGYTDLLLREDLAEDTKQTLEIVNSGARRVADIVQRLLYFARQSKPVRDFISLNQMIENTLLLKAHQLKTDNIEVVTELAPDLPQILADGGQILQVFLNIIANAEIEMSSAHGTGVLRIRSELKPNSILISFADNGPGITPDNMQKLFQPFFTTRALGKGTGLGLSVCHGIVSEHKGRIWADSQPGQGAIFFVELPLEG